VTGWASHIVKGLGWLPEGSLFALQSKQVQMLSYTAQQQLIVLINSDAACTCRAVRKQWIHATKCSILLVGDSCPMRRFAGVQKHNVCGVIWSATESAPYGVGCC
jgi:hypothetical protein